MNLRQEGQLIEVAVPSRDSAIALRMTLYEGTYPIPNRIVVGSCFTFQRPTSSEVGRVAVLFSDHFPFVQPEAFGLPEEMDREQFRLECAYARIGEYLDSNGLLPETPPNAGATSLECFTSQFQEWANRSSAKDDAILAYLRGKVYWCWKFDFSIASLTAADSLRLHTPMRTIKRVAQLGIDQLWTIAGGNDTTLMLQPRPNLIREEHENRQKLPSAETRSIGALLAAPRYAGPQAHWTKAEEFARGETRDLPNAAKEAICAVEGLARIITGQHTETLGELVKRLRTSHGLNVAATKSLEGIWGFTSNSPGVRHGGATPATIAESEAQYVLDSCEAAIRVLLPLDN